MITFLLFCMVSSFRYRAQDIADRAEKIRRGEILPYLGQ